jgi:predicted NBD/HSP70 family sugar kinase
VSDLIEQAVAGDVGPRRVIVDAAERIGFALGQMCNLFDPGRIVVGGPLSEAGDIVLDPLRHTTARHTLPSTRPSIDIVAGQLGQRAGVMGAVLTALDHVNIGTGWLKAVG